jgi:hypothetical protein
VSWERPFGVMVLLGNNNTKVVEEMEFLKTQHSFNFIMLCHLQINMTEKNYEWLEGNMSVRMKMKMVIDGKANLC